MGDSWVDGVLGDVTLDAVVVVALGVALQWTALDAVDVGDLPGAQDNFADATHCLGVRRGDREDAEVVQDVLNGDRFATNTGVCECHILWDVLVQVVADHEHVEVLVNRVLGERQGRVRRRWQHVVVAGD